MSLVSSVSAVPTADTDETSDSSKNPLYTTWKESHVLPAKPQVLMPLFIICHFVICGCKILAHRRAPLLPRMLTALSAEHLVTRDGSKGGGIIVWFRRCLADLIAVNTGGPTDASRVALPFYYHSVLLSQLVFLGGSFSDKTQFLNLQPAMQWLLHCTDYDEPPQKK